MKNEISLKGISNELFIAHLWLSRYWESYPNVPLTNIKIETIKKVVADSWGVNPKQLIGKINHADELDKAIKTSFCFAAYFYSNKSREQIAELMGCTLKYISSSVHHFICKVKYGRKGIQKQHISTLEALNKLLPERLSKILNSVDFIDKSNPVEIVALNEIDKKDKNWFISESLVNCFHPKFNRCFQISLGKQYCFREWCFAIQAAGYRFESIQNNKNSFLKNTINDSPFGALNLIDIQKICNHCMFNADCPLKNENCVGYAEAQRVGLIKACPTLSSTTSRIAAQLLPNFKDPNLKGLYGVKTEEIKKELSYRRIQN